MYRIKFQFALGFTLCLLSLPLIAGESLPSFQLAGQTIPAHCPNCHAWRPPQPQRRPLLAPHDKLLLKHGQEALWCLDCHLVQQLDRLQMRSGSSVPFTEAWQFCSECHARQVRDWRFGSHGKRLGSWQGEKIILPCSACHDAHLPAWKPAPPAPPPPQSRFISHAKP
ncbi:MAG: hypothetical protein H7832_14925 [Magnetococcus sp. DMHC-6]